MNGKSLVFAGLGAAALIVAGVFYLQERSRMRIRQKNTSVPGVVTRGSQSRSAGKIRRTEYWVEYRYTVDGKTLESGERRVNQLYPERHPMVIWYDPASPARCVSDEELHYGMDLKFVFIASTGALFAFVAAGKTFFSRSVRA